MHVGRGLWTYAVSLSSVFNVFEIDILLKKWQQVLLFLEVDEIYYDPTTQLTNVASFLTITCFSQYFELYPNTDVQLSSKAGVLMRNRGKSNFLYFQTGKILGACIPLCRPVHPNRIYLHIYSASKWVKMPPRLHQTMACVISAALREWGKAWLLWNTMKQSMLLKARLHHPLRCTLMAAWVLPLAGNCS